MSWLRAREGRAVGRLRLATQLKALFGLAGSGDQEHTGIVTVLLISMHPIPSGRPGRLDELIFEEPSSLCIPGRVEFCDGEIYLFHLLAQPIVHRKLD